MTCQGFLQCILKLINFLVTLVGAFMIVYSLWMLKEWGDMSHDDGAPSPAPALFTSGLPAMVGADMSIIGTGLQNSEELIVQQVARPFLKETFGLSDIPAPW